MKLAIALSAAAVALALAAVAPGATRDRYCSPTGDYCTAATRAAGAVKLRLATFSFSGRYRLCVKKDAQTCRSFPLRRRGEQWVSDVVWYKNFPNRGTGIYTVTWFYGGVRLGPPLKFAVANS